MSRDNYKRRERRRNLHGRDRKMANMPICPLCSRPVRDMDTAILHGTEKAPSHFDCVLLELRQREDIQLNERICYLGKGTFGIISFRNSGGPIRFLIRKRIQYEERETVSEQQV